MSRSFVTNEIIQVETSCKKFNKYLSISRRSENFRLGFTIMVFEKNIDLVGSIDKQPVHLTQNNTAQLY